MFNKHNIQAVAYFSAAFGGIAACVGSIFLGYGVVLAFTMILSGYCFFMGLIQTAKAFVLLDKVKEEEDQSWKLKPF
jgi:hypothetical protein